jgi:hypothetical protein
MSTVQVAGIAVVAVILIVIVISLIITRRKDEGGQTRQPEPSPAESTRSMFDEAPRDELHMLGKRDVAERVAEPQPRWEPAAAAAVVAGVAPVSAPFERPAAQAPEETTGEIPAAQPAEAFAVPAHLAAATQAPPVAEEVTPVAPQTDPDTSSQTAEIAGPEASSPAAEEPAAGLAEAPADESTAEEVPAQSRMVHLSDIIVTTNEQQVDLADPDVRRMLKDLVQDEIDLAAQYRQLGQNIDAVLQLTEAQRICHALGMTSNAKLIQQMINELQ